MDHFLQYEKKKQTKKDKKKKNQKCKISLILDISLGADQLQS